MVRPRLDLLFCAYFIIETGSLCAAPHAFVDLQGHVLRGEVVSVSGDVVEIRKEDGAIGRFKISDFSPADRAFIQQEATPQPTNLLTNASFEQGLASWTPHSWKSLGQVSVDDQERHEGKPTVRIDNPQPCDSSAGQKVTVKPGARYRMTAWVKTKDLRPENPKSKLGATLSVMGGFMHSTDLLDSGGWKKISFEFTNKEKTELEVGVRVGYYGTLVTGTAWFTDVNLEQVSAAKK